MSPDENKVLVLRLYDGLFNRGRLRLAEELLAADFVNHAAPAGTPTGPEGVCHVIATLRAAFPDNRYVIEDLVAEDDKVVVRLTFSGTHTGEYLGLPPTGQRVVDEQIHILRIAGGTRRGALGGVRLSGFCPPVGRTHHALVETSTLTRYAAPAAA